MFNLRDNQDKEKNKFDVMINEWLDNPENILALQKKLLNLSGFISKKEHDEAINGIKSECNSRIEQISKEKEKLEQNLEEEYGSKLQDIATQLHNKDSELKQCKDKKEEVEKQLSEFRESYGEFEEKYQIFINLPEKVRQGFSEAFGGIADRKSFMCGIVQEGYFDNAWQYINGVIGNANLTMQDKKHLAELFCFGLGLSAGKRYELIEPAGGQAFSNNTMARCSDSPQLGKVKDVLLCGYKYSGGKVIHPAIVMLEQ